VAVIDRYTYYNLEFLEKNVDITSQATMKDLFDSYDRNLIHSTPGVRTDLFRRHIDEVKITDFFGNVQSVEVGGQGQVIEESLLLGEMSSDAMGAAGTGGMNETVVGGRERGFDTLEVGSHGFEVKLQDGHVWVKVSALLACIVLWISSKRF
jgi:GPI-anchor transamidase subunit K